MREFFNNARRAIDQAVQQGRERARRQQELDLWRSSFYAAVNESMPEGMGALGMSDFWDTVSMGSLWQAVPPYVTKFSFGEERVYQRAADPKERVQPQSWDLARVNDHLGTYASGSGLRYEPVVRVVANKE